MYQKHKWPLQVQSGQSSLAFGARARAGIQVRNEAFPKENKPIKLPPWFLSGVTAGMKLLMKEGHRKQVRSCNKDQLVQGIVLW